MPNPPVPTSIKQARGTVRRDRANPAEPKPPEMHVGSRPPAWIKGTRRQRAWADLAELLGEQHLLTVLDAAALGLLIDAYGDYLEASDLITGSACGFCGRPVRSPQACSAAVDLGDGVVETLPHEGGTRYYTTRTKEGGSLMIRPHPAVAVRQDAWKRVATMLREFGMTPSARTRVTASDAPAEKDPLEAFFREGVA